MLSIFKKIFIYAFILSASLITQNIFGSATEEQTRLISSPQFYHTAEPDRLRKTYEEAILNAKRSILIYSFTFSDTVLIDLLNQRADEGIDVIVLIDKDHMGPLQDRKNEKLRVVTRHAGQGRLHHKVLVVDNLDVWLGSANLTSAAFNSQENFVIGVRSAEFAKALHGEANAIQGDQKRNDKPIPTEFFGDQEISLHILPHCTPYRKSLEKDINQRVKKELLSLIDNANSQIRIAMMVWTEPELEKAVIEAHNRGVLVEVLLQDTNNTVAKNLKKAGVFVISNPHLNFLHNKWMWVDETILVNGSANWSKSSFSRNDESFFVLKNLSEDQKRYIEDYWNNLRNR